MPKPYSNRERLLLFASDVTRLGEKLRERSAVARELVPQLVSAANSAVANAEEADAASSRKDFRAKELICLRELKESRARLRVLRNAGYLTLEEAELIDESDQLVKIVSTIIRNAAR